MLGLATMPDVKEEGIEENEIEEILLLLEDRKQKGPNYYKPLDQRRSQLIRDHYKSKTQFDLEGNPRAVLATKQGLIVCRGYTRVVVGDYGPYIEFSPEQKGEAVPKTGSGGNKYNWLRTADGTKVYEQLGEVAYADYRSGMYYVSPEDVSQTRVGCWSERDGDGSMVYIGRAGHGQSGYFGNPIRRNEQCFICGEYHRAGASTLACFESYARQRMGIDGEYRQRVLNLAGKELGCFCGSGLSSEKPWICHGQVLAYLAESSLYRK